MRYFKLKTTGAAAIATILLLAGCAKEVEVDGGGNGTPVSGDDVTVLMTLNIPGAAGTRGLSGTQEKNVNNVDIFVFDKDLKLTDWQYGELVDNSGDVSFSATLRASRDNADKFRLMVLANVRQTTYGLFSGTNLGGHKGKTYAEVRALLEAVVPTYSQLTSRGIPMWGEIDDMVLLTGTSNSYSMDLLRSLARIDIGTHSNPAWQASGQITGWAPLDNFSLEEIYVYNAGTHYALAADRANYSFTDKKVNTYSLPSITDKGAAKKYSDDVLSGTVTRSGTTGVSVTANIYTGEADVKMGVSGSYADDNHPDRMALVVGGYYSDAPDPSKLCYYRLDLLEGTNGTTLMDVLRNGNYQIVINSVGGPGSESPDEAFRKFNANMVVVVNSWSDAGQQGTTVSGDHWLKVNPYDIEVDKWARVDEEITVETNVPVAGGTSWSAAVAKVNETDADPSWLTITSGTNTGISGGLLKYNVAQVPDSFTETSSRSARIVITAGTMNYSLIVTQTGKDGDHMLRLSHSEFVFAGRKWDATNGVWVNPDPQDISVNWGSRKYPYELELTDYTGEGVDMAAGSIPASSEEPRFTISPVMIADDNPNLDDNPFFERSSRLAFTARNTAGDETITKQVMIRQVYYSLVLSGTKDYYYQGNTYTLNIKSNSAWTAVVSDPGGILTGISYPSTSGNTSSGEGFTFKIKDNAAIDARATVTFSNPANLFPPQTITIIAQDELPNSYVIAPGGVQTIPVRKAYRVWELDRDLYNDNNGQTLPMGSEEAVLLWQDAQDLIGTVGLSGSGRNAQIVVTTKNNTTKGNAVVAYKINGEVYWSWHIWVTPDDPNNTANQGSANGYTFMDRNLGAFGTSGYDAFGLWYQGSRKDPMPPFAATSGATRRTVYDIDNVAMEYEMAGGIDVLPGLPEGGLPHSIHNPKSFIKGHYGTGWWYGLLIDEMRNDLWENGTYKSDYDPCPDGWRIPLENAFAGMESLSATTSNFMWNDMYWPSQGIIWYSYNFHIGHFYIWFIHKNSTPRARAITGGTNTTSSRMNACPIRCVKH